jgi:decaprenyl-phosphate phosphoribosyltransferase
MAIDASTQTDASPRRSAARAWIAALRPRQWPKNLLVFAAPLAAGRLTEWHVLLGSLLAFLVFVIASAGTYLVNDSRDVERDRRHPHKRTRPIAAGEIGVSAAYRVGLAAMALSVALSLISRWQLAAVIVGYLVVQYGYSHGLKSVAGVELLLLTAGFVLRPLAGSAATGVPPSAPFLGVCLLAALGVAAGKRVAEVAALGDDAHHHRHSLRHYTVDMLRLTRNLALVGAVACYIGWALTRPTGHLRTFELISAVPLSVALARYAWCNDRGQGGAPEELALSDRMLQVAGVVWLAAFLAGIGHV